MKESNAGARYAGLTRELSRIITTTRYEDLGEECTQRVKIAIKDGIAVAVAGCDQRPVKIFAKHVEGIGARAQSTVWGYGFKTSPMFAACINGMSTHVLDFEPVWSPPTHAISPTMPVAFALAETRGLSGRQIVTAVAKGMEIQGRMQYAGSLYVPEQLFLHPPGMVGVMGAAVTASHMLKLDEQRLRYALGIAGSRAGGLIANIGSMTKSLHCGNAGAAGFEAALLAQQGFTANADIFEAYKGIITTFYHGKFDSEKLLGYADPWRIVDPGLAIKLFPCQYGTQFSVTAGLELAPQIPDKSKIAHVTITGPVMTDTDRPEPVSGLAGKHSFHYTVAAAILDGKVNIDTFSDARRFKPDMVKLLRKIELRQDPSIPNDLHKMQIRIAVDTDDGKRYESVCRGPKGSWGMPPLDPKDHDVKLKDCLKRMLDSKRMERVLSLLDRLERLNAAGVREIISLLAARRATKQPRGRSRTK